MTVALLVSSLQEGSETFVKRHIELLGKDTVVIYGGLTPFKTEQFDESDSFFVKMLFRFRSLFDNSLSIRDFLLQRLLKKYAIKTCYAEFGPVGAGALKACKKSDVNLIVNFHGYDAFRLDILNDYKSQYQALFEYCKSIVVVSQSMREHIQALGCAEDKLVYMPCYPDPKFGQLNYSPSQKRITFIGRFVEKKAPWLLILAFREVLSQHPDAELWMVGDGPLKSICESTVNALNIPNVTFTGMVAHDELNSVFASTMVYAQHSIIAANGDREGTPVSIMEALSAGIPIVSTRHEGIQDIINSDEVGLLIDEQDVLGMAKAICQLLGDEALRLTMSANAKLRAKEIFSDHEGEHQISRVVR